MFRDFLVDRMHQMKCSGTAGEDADEFVKYVDLLCERLAAVCHSLHAFWKDLRADLDPDRKSVV